MNENGYPRQHRIPTTVSHSSAVESSAEGVLFPSTSKQNQKNSEVFPCRLKILSIVATDARFWRNLCKGCIMVHTFTFWWTTRRFAVSRLLLRWLEQNKEEKFYNHDKGLEHMITHLMIQKYKKKTNLWVEN